MVLILVCWLEFIVGVVIAGAVLLRARKMPKGWLRLWTELSVAGFVAGLFFGAIIANEPLWAPLAGLVFGPLAALSGMTDNIMIARAAEQDAARHAEIKQRRDDLRALFRKGDGSPP